MYSKYLDIKPEVAKALEEGTPVVALESTIISHGMPYPKNVETAIAVENVLRAHDVMPATIAIIGGRIKIGLTEEEIEYMATAENVLKVSRRDFPLTISQGLDGATTVAGTMIAAHMAGIRLFVTGGIGGVHRGAGESFDISADLEELKMTGCDRRMRRRKIYFGYRRDLRIFGNRGCSGRDLRRGSVPCVLQQRKRICGGLQSGRSGEDRGDDQEQGRARPARRHARDEPDPRGVLHGSGRHQQGHRRGH